MILHTLFESGITEVQDLERYIQEDVVRYGTRMGELEKKLKTAYTDTVCALIYAQSVISIEHI
jgi:transcriptional activator SPT7